VVSFYFTALIPAICCEHCSVNTDYISVHCIACILTHWSLSYWRIFPKGATLFPDRGS